MQAGAGRRLDRRAAAAALLLALAALTQPALAAGKAGATGSHGAASGTWAAIPTTSSSATPAAGSTVSLAFTLVTTNQYFYVVNTGSRTLAGLSYQMTGVGAGTTVSLWACVGGTWNTLLNTCSGTATSLGVSFTQASSGPSATTVAVPAAADSRVHIQARASIAVLFTATVSTSVTSGSGAGQVAATTTNA